MQLLKIRLMMKQCKDLTVAAVEHPADGYVLIRLTDVAPLPDMAAGQFVEVRIDDSPATFLRRPVSVNYVDRKANELWLLVQIVGEGTRRLSSLRAGDVLNVLFPLGNGFTPGTSGESVLLVGGGVGTAPLLEYGRQLREAGACPVFLLGGRSGRNILQLDLFEALGETHVTTEDGSLGERGFVTDSTIFASVMNSGQDAGGGNPVQGRFRISCCGPKPMMVAVARKAREYGVRCEVSLENMMACGLGACLCCVEKTVKGNVCVCKEGPVFDVEQLLF